MKLCMRWADAPERLRKMFWGVMNGDVVQQSGHGGGGLFLFPQTVVNFRGHGRVGKTAGGGGAWLKGQLIVQEGSHGCQVRAASTSRLGLSRSPEKVDPFLKPRSEIEFEGATRCHAGWRAAVKGLDRQGRLLDLSKTFSAPFTM